VFFKNFFKGNNTGVAEKNFAKPDDGGYSAQAVHNQKRGQHNRDTQRRDKRDGRSRGAAAKRRNLPQIV